MKRSQGVWLFGVSTGIVISLNLLNPEIDSPRTLYALLSGGFAFSGGMIGAACKRYYQIRYYLDGNERTK